MRKPGLANYRGTDWDYGGQIHSGAYGAGPHGVYREQTTEVGIFSPNWFGLYDMHGNVYEWCQDLWHHNYGDAPYDGSTWLTQTGESFRVVRGGSCHNPPDFCRSGCRRRFGADAHNNGLGIRVVWVSREHSRLSELVEGISSGVPSGVQTCSSEVGDSLRKST